MIEENIIGSPVSNGIDEDLIGNFTSLGTLDPIDLRSENLSFVPALFCQVKD